MPFEPPASDRWAPPAEDRQQPESAAVFLADQVTAGQSSLQPAGPQFSPIEQAVEDLAPGFGSTAGRGTFEAAGAAVGAGIGMVAGPAAPATVPVASVLGAMGGTAAYDAVNELIDFVHGKEPLGSGWERAQQNADNALGAGAFEAGTMGLMRLFMPAVRGMGRLLTGVSPSQAPRVSSANDLGLTPSASTIGSRAKPFSSATERLPMAGSGKSAKRITGEVDALLESTANAMGEPLLRDEAANVVALGGRRNALKLMDSYKARYKVVEDISKSLGDPKVFSSRFMSGTANEFLGTVGEARVPTTTVKDLTARGRGITPETFLDGVGSLGDQPLSYPQVQALRRTANRLLEQTLPAVPGGAYKDPDGYRGLQAFLGSIGTTIKRGRNLDLVQAWDAADTEFKNFKSFINQPAFSEFRAAVPGITTPNVFNRPQTAEVQNLLDTLVKEQSPNVLRSLRVLIGDEGFSQIRRRAFTEDLGSFVQPVESGGVRLHAAAMKHKWGLDGQNPEGLARMEALLEGSDIGIGDVRRLADGLELVGDQFLPQVSQFMMRRLMLQTAGGGVKGGAHNILGSLLLGGAGGSVATQGIGAAASGALYTLMGLRVINEALNSPKVLGSMLKAIDASKAGRPTEMFIRRALLQMERNQDGGEQPSDRPPFVQGATEQLAVPGPQSP